MKLILVTDANPTLIYTNSEGVERSVNVHFARAEVEQRPQEFYLEGVN